jgi:hypothetical protein
MDEFRKNPLRDTSAITVSTPLPQPVRPSGSAIVSNFVYFAKRRSRRFSSAMQPRLAALSRP